MVYPNGGEGIVSKDSDSMLKRMKGLSVLIVDDDPLVREVFSLFLQKRGVMTYTASDAAYAIEIVGKYRPGIVILDLHLGISPYQGTQVLWQIKRNPDTASTVVLIYTGYKEKALEEICMEEMGADGYILKESLDWTTLTATLASWIRRLRPVHSKDELSAGPVGFSLSHQKAFVGPRCLPLTPREYNVLFCAVRKSPDVIGWGWLSRKFWDMRGGTYSEAPLLVLACVNHLGAKLGEAASRLVRIPQVGVRWVV